MSKPDDTFTVYVLTGDWSGLHEMFEKESFDALAGVPLVPMLWKALAEQGHRVHVFVLGEFSTEKDFDIAGFRVHRLHFPEVLRGSVMTGRYLRSVLKPGFLVSQVKLIRAALRVARSDPPEVIYSYRSDTAVAGFLLSRRLRAIHVARRWGTWLAYVFQQQPWYRWIRHWGEILSYKIPYDLFIMSNDGTQGDQAARRLRFPMAKHRFWLDGTARGIYQPDLDTAAVKRSIGLDAEDKMIFGVARLDFWKRFDRTIAAMPQVLRRVPRARLVIAGEGPLRGELERQIASLDLAGSVRLLGSTPHEKVRQLHNAADLFVTVQDLTNLGNQLLEAMHSGTCVVAYDVGGTRDVAKDDVNCVLLDEAGLSRLGEVIADLLLDDARRARLAAGAREYALKHIWFWDERTAAEIREVEKLVQDRRRSRGGGGRPRRGTQPDRAATV
jgi:glycosyltransferase involved in cell wall biosynthesis